MLLDQIDGVLARVCNAQSRIGAELDSFADFVAFGLAPAFLVIGVPGTGGDVWRSGSEGALAVLYVYGCTLRLARNNALDAEVSPGTFRGIPSTLAGVLVASAILTASVHGVVLEGQRLAWLLAVLGVLMLMRPLRIPKIHILMARVAARGGVGMLLVLGNLVAVYGLVMARALPEYVLVLALVYAICGSVIGTRQAVHSS
jgi:CDP-diacylglycerol--serine O-phosphatidyltransferase